MKSIAYQLVTLRLHLGETDSDDPRSSELTCSKLLPFVLDLLFIHLHSVRRIEIESKTLLLDVILAVSHCHPTLEIVGIYSKLSPVPYGDLRR